MATKQAQEMTAPLQAAVQFSDLRADPDFMAAPPVEQVQYLLEDYLPKQDPEFAKAPQQEKLQYIQEAVMPQIHTPEIQGPARPSVEIPQFGKDLAAAGMLTATGALKGLTFGYGDLTDDARTAAAGIGASPELWRRTAPRSNLPLGINPQTLAGDIATGGGDFAGMLGGMSAIGKIGAGIGSKIAPRITPLAEAAGQALPMADKLRKAQQFLESGSLAARMAQGAAELGTYEAVKSHPENQFDLGARALSGASGAVMGAALPVALAGAGKVLKGGVQFIQDLAKPSELPVGLMRQAERSIKQAAMKQYEALVEVFGKLQRGEIDPALVSPDDYAALVTKMDEVAQAIQKGKPVAKDAQGIARKIEGRAKVTANNQKRPINVQKAETKLENRPAAENPQNQPEGTASEPDAEQPKAEAVALPENAGSMTAGQVEKQIGRKLTQEEKDIHANLRAVARAEVVDEARGIHKQLPLSGRELKYSDVKDSISPEFQKDAQIIDEAMGQGKAVRVEYAAEEAGRSMEAAKITAAGNVKAETTTFTPLYWGKTKEGKVLLHGYNQRGFFTTYHLEPSASGSQILKAKASEKAPFVGEYSNVYLGQRPFLAKDVLNRGIRSEEGPVKTSEAISMMEEVANNLDKVFKLIDDPRIPPNARQMLKELQNKPKWTQKDIKKLQMWINKKEFRNAVCDILGLSHA